MIQAERLSCFYRDGANLIKAVNGIDLTIQKGEWVVLTGPNGSGKSTLLRLINGLLVPSEGRLTVAGMDLTNASNREQVKLRVQVVFQNPDAQAIGTTPQEDVAFGLENRGIDRAQMEERIERALHQVGLREKRSASVSELSGGQKQRLAIASCLALEPDCLLFDEATSMLDPAGRRDIYLLARTLWRNGMTVIWATQRLDELLEADRAVVMDAGGIEYDGAPRHLFYDSDVPQRLGWELPPVVKIGCWLRERGIPLPSLPLREEEVAGLLCGLH
ncbi:ATP-binding cassette domain-containing protein [Effusibacillus dendaii]|uniref:Energy-coupling factor transporter ATP-binding protein EcfA n=1 Tax=Effusibacillus dendaii TaxID=2743772 RepID=A0A7I8DE44_9BACL|nr:ATP-binding cassette domain-containing protein [Effusibacillus dendaii]BCJ86780.1 energy-coupling factor transporter ATP-binding protein EcfA [Effusibacillus dendaii]